jgi:hypothetical protein
MKEKLSKAAVEFFRRQGAKGGKLSTKARMEKLTPEQRSEIARKAAAASAKVRSTKAKQKAAASDKKSSPKPKERARHAATARWKKA